jgi:hypothetical protein
MIYSKYLVKETDLFEPANFPSISDDLDVIEAAMVLAPGSHCAEMLVSFARNHSLDGEWVKVNPVMAGQISSRSLPVANLEALFSAARNHPVFLRSLEQYLQNRFSPISPITV